MNPDNFNMNMLQNAPADSLSGESAMSSAGDDGMNFAAQLAGGGAEFVIPTAKKSMSLGMMVFVGVAVLAAGGLWWMHKRTGGPTPAEAADPGVTAARESIQQFLAGGTGSVKEMKTLLADSAQITDKFATYSEDRQVPLEELKTNPFYTETGETTQEAPAVDMTRMQQEERARREAEKKRLETERLTLAASKLQVQTIFFGRNPTALVDGKICQVGQQLGDFTVTAIRPDAIEIKSGEHTFEVKLKGGL